MKVIYSLSALFLVPIVSAQSSPLRPADVAEALKNPPPDVSAKVDYLKYKILKTKDYKTLAMLSSGVNGYMAAEGNPDFQQMSQSIGVAGKEYDDDQKIPSLSKSAQLGSILDRTANFLLQSDPELKVISPLVDYATSDSRQGLEAQARSDEFQKNQQRQAELEQTLTAAVFIASKDPAVRNVFNAALNAGSVLADVLVPGADLTKDPDYNPSQKNADQATRDLIRKTYTDVTAIRARQDLSDDEKEKQTLDIINKGFVTVSGKLGDLQKTDQKILSELTKAPAVDNSQYAQNEATLEDLKNGGDAFFSLIAAIDPKDATKVMAGFNAGIKVGEALNKFANLNLTDLAAMTNVFSAATTLISLFASSGPSAQQLMMQQMQQMQQQLNQIANLMQKDFATVDQHIIDLSNQVAQGFEQVVNGQLIASTESNNLQKMVSQLTDRIQLLETNLPRYFDALYQRMLANQLNLCLDGQATLKSFKLSAKDYTACLIQTAKYGTTDAEDELASAGQRKMGDGDLATELQSHSLEENIQFLSDFASTKLHFASARSIDSTGSTLPLANMGYWAAAVDNYNRLLNLNLIDPKMAASATPLQTQNLLREGLHFQSWIQGLRGLALINHLQSFYAGKNANLQKALASFDQAFHQDLRLSSKDAPFSIWGNWTQNWVGTPTATTSAQYLWPTGQMNLRVPLPDGLKWNDLTMPTKALEARLPTVYRMAVFLGLAKITWNWIPAQIEEDQPGRTYVYLIKSVILQATLTFKDSAGKEQKITSEEFQIAVPKGHQGLAYAVVRGSPGGFLNLTNTNFDIATGFTGFFSNTMASNDTSQDFETWWDQQKDKDVSDLLFQNADSQKVQIELNNLEIVKLWTQLKTVNGAAKLMENDPEELLFAQVLKKFTELQNQYYSLFALALDGQQIQTGPNLDSAKTSISTALSELNGAKLLLQDFTMLAFPQTLQQSALVSDGLYSDTRGLFTKERAIPFLKALGAQKFDVVKADYTADPRDPSPLPSPVKVLGQALQNHLTNFMAGLTRGQKNARGQFLKPELSDEIRERIATLQLTLTHQQETSK